MKALIIPIFIALTSCVPSQSDVTNACAEINSTRVMDSNIRMNILKEYGFSPLQAELYQRVLKDITLPTADVLDFEDESVRLIMQSRPDYQKFLRCSPAVGLSCEVMLQRIADGMTYDEIGAKVDELFSACMEQPHE